MHALRLADGRLHLQHGPIDCIVEAWGDPVEVEAAYTQAKRRFDGLLPVLVQELPLLRAPIDGAHPLAHGPVARRMVAAAWPHRSVFLTPMIAVAGAVADEVLAGMVAGCRLHKAYVNNGGDIALHLDGYAEFDAGIVTDPDAPSVDARIHIGANQPVRGIATSGWRGRSQSLGIADAVTVLAGNAAAADAAATLIANAVNAEHPHIRRLPACGVKEDSDLGERLVTVEVPALPRGIVDQALARGLEEAQRMRDAGLIMDAFLSLQGCTLATCDAAALRHTGTRP